MDVKKRKLETDDIVGALGEKNIYLNFWTRLKFNPTQNLLTSLVLIRNFFSYFCSVRVFIGVLRNYLCTYTAAFLPIWQFIFKIVFFRKSKDVKNGN